MHRHGEWMKTECCVSTNDWMSSFFWNVSNDQPPFTTSPSKKPTKKKTKNNNKIRTSCRTSEPMCSGCATSRKTVYVLPWKPHVLQEHPLSMMKKNEPEIVEEEEDNNQEEEEEEEWVDIEDPSTPNSLRKDAWMAWMLFTMLQKSKQTWMLRMAKAFRTWQLEKKNMRKKKMMKKMMTMMMRMMGEKQEKIQKMGLMEVKKGSQDPLKEKTSNEHENESWFIPSKKSSHSKKKHSSKKNHPTKKKHAKKKGNHKKKRNPSVSQTKRNNTYKGSHSAEEEEVVEEQDEVEEQERVEEVEEQERVEEEENDEREEEQEEDAETKEMEDGVVEEKEDVKEHLVLLEERKAPVNTKEKERENEPEKKPSSPLISFYCTTRPMPSKGEPDPAWNTVVKKPAKKSKAKRKKANPKMEPSIVSPYLENVHEPPSRTKPTPTCLPKPFVPAPPGLLPPSPPVAFHDGWSLFLPQGPHPEFITSPLLFSKRLDTPVHPFGAVGMRSKASLN